MAFAGAPPRTLIFRPLSNSRLISAVRSPSISVSHSTVRFASSSCKRNVSVRSSSVPAAPTPPSLAPAISLTEKALKHLNKIRSEKNEDICLRIGVKQGGCSGMSYTMDFEDRADASPDDSTIDYDGFTIVCDPKSLLFLYGMELDFSDSLIGGGFSFRNPNATKTCSCGKSFGMGTEKIDEKNAQCV